jgi:hypothetical protein
MTDRLEAVIYNIFAPMIFSAKTHFNINIHAFFHSLTEPFQFLSVTESIIYSIVSYIVIALTVKGNSFIES